MERFKPVVVGVDATHESARAAALGWKIARRAGIECRLVHVMPDYTSEAFSLVLPPNFAVMQEALAKESRKDVESVLRTTLPGEALRALFIKSGRPATELVALSADAELLVLGGKHHTALGRWFVGSTAHQVVRMSETPVLIVGPSPDPPMRVLAAVDLSAGSEPTILAAQRLAELFGAELRVLHVIEPLPPIMTASGVLAAGPVAIEPESWYRTAREAFAQMVERLVEYPRAHSAVAQGAAEAQIRHQVAEWRADLLVVGSHGKGALDRLMIGSVTHHLLNDLPASLLMVPVMVGAAVEAA